MKACVCGYGSRRKITSSRKQKLILSSVLGPTRPTIFCASVDISCSTQGTRLRKFMWERHSCKTRAAGMVALTNESNGDVTAQ